MTTDTKKYNPFFRQLLFLGLLITVGLTILHQLNFFIGSFLGGITLYIVLRNLFFRMTEGDKPKFKRWSASLLLTAGITILLLGIGFLIFELLAKQINNIDTSQIVVGFNGVVNKVNDMFNVRIVPENIISQSTSYITKFISGIVNSTYSFAINVFLMLIILYFMLVHARTLEQKVYEYKPFTGQSWNMLRTESKNMIFSNAVGIPVVMIGQGLAAALVYWLLGLDNVVFWAFFTALCGLIPMIGTVIVTLPLGIYLIANGGLWQGIVLIVCGLFVVANVDNVIRMVLLKKAADTHPLIVIFGVIMGIPLFGFWGIIFGPLLLSGFLLLIKIYYHEYRLIAEEKGKR